MKAIPSAQLLLPTQGTHDVHLHVSALFVCRQQRTGINAVCQLRKEFAANNMSGRIRRTREPEGPGALEQTASETFLLRNARQQCMCFCGKRKRDKTGPLRTSCCSTIPCVQWRNIRFPIRVFRFAMRIKPHQQSQQVKCSLCAVRTRKISISIQIEESVVFFL